MRLTLTIFLPAAIIGAVIFSGFQLQSALATRSAEQKFTAYKTILQDQLQAFSSPPGQQGNRVLRHSGGDLGTVAKGGTIRDRRTVQREAEEAATASVKVPFAPARAHISRATFLRFLAEQEGNVEKRIELYCSALHEYGLASQKAPRDAKVLMNWANLRQILGTVDCGENLTAGDYREAITTAVRLDPTDGGAKYAAGLILAWGGEGSLARALFQQALRYSTQLSDRQVNGILSQAQDGPTLSAIVPARFPRIVDASSYFAKRIPLQFEVGSRRDEFVLALARLQLQAVRDSVRDYENKSIPFELHVDRLERLLPYVELDGVRKVIDRELALLLAERGQPSLAQYLVQRSDLRSLRIVPGMVVADTRPMKTTLAQWGGNQEPIYIDEFYQSVGGYVGSQQALRSVELVLGENPTPSFVKSLKFFVSEDNVNWNEISTQLSAQNFQLGKHWLVVWQLPPRTERYFKINYSNPGRNRTLSGDLNQLVRAYGNRAAPRDALDDEAL